MTWELVERRQRVRTQVDSRANRTRVFALHSATDALQRHTANSLPLVA